MASDNKIGTGLLPRLIVGILVPILLAFLIIGCVLFVSVNVGSFQFASMRGIGLEGIRDLGAASTKEATDSLNKLGEQIIEQKAVDVARQIEIFMRARPGKSMTAYLDDPTFKDIALQKVGQTGYTLITEGPEGIIRIHPQAAALGQAVRSAQSPELMKVMDASAKASNGIASGYYPWKEPDGRVRQKYMTVITFKGTPYYQLPVTAYIDEFSQPAKAISAKIGQMQRTYQSEYAKKFWIFLVIVVVDLAILLAAIVLYASSIIRPIRHLSQVADRISMGDLQASIDMRGKGEVVVLAQSIERMQTSVKAAIERLQKRREGAPK